MDDALPETDHRMVRDVQHRRAAFGLGRIPSIKTSEGQWAATRGDGINGP